MHRQFLRPLDLSDEQWRDIKQIALVVMSDCKCDYAKAVVVSYIRLFELAENDESRH